MSLMAVSSLGAQSLSITPHFNFHFPACRLADNSQGHPSFRARNIHGGISGDLGVFLEYKSEENWGLSSGISIGAVGYGYRISANDLGGPISGADFFHVTSGSLHRVPILFNYTWKKVRLFELRNHRKVKKKRRPRVADESILYALVFKVQPMIGASVNYIGKLHRRDNADDTLGISIINPYFNVSELERELSHVNVSAIAGVRLQFYSFGKDKLALTVLYHQGFSDLREAEINYTINGEGPYQSHVRTRGSGLSLTLSYPIQIYNFNKQERELRRRKE